MAKTIEEINREFLEKFNIINEAEENEVFQEETIEAAVPVDEPVYEKQEIGSTEAVARSAHSSQPLWKDLVSLLLKAAVIAMAFVLLFTFLFGLIRYQEPSMDPAIKDGDLVIFYRYTKVGYLPQDVIVLERNGKMQVRRVVATAGDVVDITENGLSINGSIQQETGIYQKTERYVDGVDFPLTVLDGQVFVLGDSRGGATDSRIYGSVEIKDTLGKVIAVIRRRAF